MSRRAQELMTRMNNRPRDKCMDKQTDRTNEQTAGRIESGKQFQTYTETERQRAGQTRGWGGTCGLSIRAWSGHEHAPRRRFFPVDVTYGRRFRGLPCMRLLNSSMAANKAKMATRSARSNTPDPDIIAGKGPNTAAMKQVSTNG